MEMEKELEGLLEVFPLDKKIKRLHLLYQRLNCQGQDSLPESQRLSEPTVSISVAEGSPYQT